MEAMNSFAAILVLTVLFGGIFATAMALTMMAPRPFTPPYRATRLQSSKSSATIEEGATTTRDWAQYALQQQYKKAGGMLYKQSALTPLEYTTIINELQVMDLKMKEEKESSFATNRVGAQISNGSRIYDVLSCEEGSMCRLVNCLADGDCDDKGKDNLGRMVLAPDIPIEVSFDSLCLILLSREVINPSCSYVLFHI